MSVKKKKKKKKKKKEEIPFYPPLFSSSPILSPTFHKLVSISNIGGMVLVVVQIQSLGGDDRGQTLGDLVVQGGESEDTSPLKTNVREMLRG